MTRTRQIAHQLIDQLPEGHLSGLVQFLDSVVNQSPDFANSIELDDEPETESEKQSVLESHEWIKANGGKGIPHDEAMRQLALN